MDGWIVIYIPRGITWTTSSSNYHYDTQSQTFHQTALSAQLLSAMGKVNGEAMKGIVLESEVRLGRVRAGDEEVVVAAGKTLGALCEIGAREEALAPKVLEVVMGELERQTRLVRWWPRPRFRGPPADRPTLRYGVLLAIDEVQALFTTSEIADPRGKRVPGWALSGVRLFLDFITGRRSFVSVAVGYPPAVREIR
jgi:small subunit ribosomal protein S29